MSGGGTIRGSDQRMGKEVISIVQGVSRGEDRMTLPRNERCTNAIRTRRAARANAMAVLAAVLVGAVLLRPLESPGQESSMPVTRAVRYIERVIALGNVRLQNPCRIR